MRRFCIGILVVGISRVMAADNAAPRPDIKDLTAYFGSLPPAEIPAFTSERAMALVAMPLACVDHPHSLPEQRTDYLWISDVKSHMLDTYATTRAFYGCSDWHSAVNSTWTLITVLKQFPEISVGKLIREKLREHLGKKNIEGEMEFFKTSKTSGRNDPSNESPEHGRHANQGTYQLHPAAGIFDTKPFSRTVRSKF